MGKSCHHVVFNEAKKIIKIKSRIVARGARSPTFFGWGGNAVCTLRALSFDRVSRVGLFLFVRVCLAPWGGGVGKVVIKNYYVSLRVTWR